MKNKITLLMAGAMALGVSAFAQVPQACLMEEFTSSTCPPCKSFNQFFDPLVNGAPNNVNTPAANFNIIKYQMNWPSPGNDASYNPHGYTRRQYYQVTGVPDHFTNGATGTGGSASSVQSEINSCKGGTTPVSISGTYEVQGDSLLVNVTIQTSTALTGAHKVHIAATEWHYQNTANTTGQLDYYHVMRRMFPDGNGTTLNATPGTPQTLTFKVKYDVGSVAQNSFTFWNHPRTSNLIVFVQHNSSKEVVQSKVIPAQWATGVNDVTASMGNVAVYPNPAVDQAAVLVELTEATTVQIRVTDMLGRTVYTTDKKQYAAGTLQEVINTSNLMAGNYFVTIQTDNGAKTERLTVK